MTAWLVAGVLLLAFAAVTAMALMAERRADPEPDREWQPNELPSVRTEDQIDAAQTARRQAQEQRRAWRPDRGDTQ